MSFAPFGDKSGKRRAEPAAAAMISGNFATISASPRDDIPRRPRRFDYACLLPCGGLATHWIGAYAMAHFDRSLGKTTYRAFLVRLWRDGPQGAWHASAQHVQSREVTHFAALQGLFTYLENATHSDTNRDTGASAATGDTDRNAGE